MRSGSSCVETGPSVLDCGRNRRLAARLPSAERVCQVLRCESHGQMHRSPQRPWPRAGRGPASVGTVIVWINGTHGVGKTTISALVQTLIPDSRVFDAEMVGEMLMNITPGLPETDNFQHWPPWRPLVVETARRILDYTGGLLVIPMTVLVERYWREISSGLAQYGIPIMHFVLHADQETLRRRIEADLVMGPSAFRLGYLEAYAEAARDWLHDDAQVIDTSDVNAEVVADRIAQAVTGLGRGV